MFAAGDADALKKAVTLLNPSRVNMEELKRFDSNFMLTQKKWMSAINFARSFNGNPSSPNALAPNSKLILL